MNHVLLTRDNHPARPGDLVMIRANLFNAHGELIHVNGRLGSGGTPVPAMVIAGPHGPPRGHGLRGWSMSSGDDIVTVICSGRIAYIWLEQVLEVLK